jgi:predicted adenylyl cyclase CyaB
MTREIEIKLWYNNKEELVAHLNKLGAKFIKKTILKDIYLHNDKVLVPYEILRLREDAGKFELTFKGNMNKDTNVWNRKEITAKVHSKEEVLALLDCLGFKITSNITDDREFWELDGVEIHFLSKVSANVPRTDYLEIEGPTEEEVNQMVERLKPHVRIVTKEETHKFAKKSGVYKNK